MLIHTWGRRHFKISLSFWCKILCVLKYPSWSCSMRLLSRWRVCDVGVFVFVLHTPHLNMVLCFLWWTVYYWLMSSSPLQVLQYSCCHDHSTNASYSFLFICCIPFIIDTHCVKHKKIKNKKFNSGAEFKEHNGKICKPFVPKTDALQRCISGRSNQPHQYRMKLQLLEGCLHY